MTMQRCFLLGLACLLLTGCGGLSTTPVEGTVKFNGEPLKQGTVELVPQGSDFPAASNPVGAIKDDGSFLISTDKSTGAPAGEYKVVVRSTVPADPNDEYSLPKSVIPDIYGKAASTPLSLTVPSDQYDLELEGKAK